MIIIGQDKLLNNLFKYSEEAFPHSLLFVGPVGCGKHSLVEQVGTTLSMSIVDITSNIDLDYIQEMYTNPIPTIYMVDMNKVTEREQNVILKLLEEPTDSVYLILITTSKALLLNTIINRCQVFEFEPYSKESLLSFVTVDNADLMIKYCTTPGQIKSTDVKQIEEIVKSVDEMLNEVKYSSLLQIANRVIEKKWDVDLFYRVLLNRTEEKYLENKSEVLYNMYYVESKSYKKLSDSRYAKRNILESLADEMWHVAIGK